MTLLDQPARQGFLDTHTSWELVDETIERTFVFSDFNAAIGFVVRVAILAEQADHHPDIDIRWNKVSIALTTHDSGGLTTKDTNLASAIESLTSM